MDVKRACHEVAWSSPASARLAEEMARILDAPIRERRWPTAAEWKKFDALMAALDESVESDIARACRLNLVKRAEYAKRLQGIAVSP